MTAWSVLVVDDQKNWQDLLSMVIEVDPRFVLDGVAANGREAIQMVQGDCPNAIVLDVQMPEVDGLRALPLLRESCHQSVIVMYSSEPASACRAERLGADDVLDKGISPMDVLDRLAELSRRKNR